MYFSFGFAFVNLFFNNITWKITKKQGIIITIKPLRGKVPISHLSQIVKVSQKLFSNKLTKTDNLLSLINIYNKNRTKETTNLSSYLEKLRSSQAYSKPC